MNTDPKIVAARMQFIAERYKDNPDYAHGHADDFLCELLRELGYTEAVEIFERMEKWYS